VKKINYQSLKALLIVLILGYAVALYNTAWLDDDAHITFRVIDNFYSGFGLRWNIVERVQAYTHPLWLMVIAAVYSMTHEFFLTVIILSMVFSFCSVMIFIFLVSESINLAILGSAFLLFSKSFVEFSTSGLENPLSYILLALFVWRFKKKSQSGMDLLALSFIASLFILTRHDGILLIGPAAVSSYITTRSFKRPLIVILGASPFILWEIFSLIYYGFFLPNTAYAKLTTYIPLNTLLVQGQHYFENQWHFDSLSLIVIAIAICVPIFKRSWKFAALSCGLLFYLSYLLIIGGDFMLGRFFAVPLFMAVLIIGGIGGHLNAGFVVACVAGSAILGLSAPNPALLTGRDYGIKPLKPYQQPSYGVGDERFFYYQGCGLRQYNPGKAMPLHEWFTYVGKLFREKPGIQRIGAIGMIGLAAGPQNFLIDAFGLSDPLLARLPAFKKLRTGHFQRHVPAGYIETIRKGDVRFLDPKLGEYYQHLMRVVRGPLFSRERWRSIWLLNTGQLSHLIDIAYYSQPALPVISISELEALKYADAHRDWVDVIKISPTSGLKVKLLSKWHYPTLDVSLDPKVQYEFHFYLKDIHLGTTRLLSPSGKNPFLVRTGVEVPNDVLRAGYDEIQIKTVSSNLQAIGHLLGSNIPSCITLEQLLSPKLEHSDPRQVGAIEILPFHPLRILLNNLKRSRRIDLSFDYNDTYRLSFYQKNMLLAEIDIAGQPSFGGLSRVVLNVPEMAYYKGYDELRISVMMTDGYASVGHLILIEPSEAKN